MTEKNYLRKSEVYVKKKKKVSNVTEKLVEHRIHCLPCSYTNGIILYIITETMMSH